MGNTSIKKEKYESILPPYDFTSEMMTDREVEYKFGEPERVETFHTGFLMNNPVIEDNFIVKYGKYIYKRYVYPNNCVYFMKFKDQCFAWHYQDITGE